VPRAISAVTFFVESGTATVAGGLASQPARAITLAAKNNGSHLDIAPRVQVWAVLRMLSDTDPCSEALQRRPAWAPNTRCKGNQLVKARGLALRLAPDFIMAG